MHRLESGNVDSNFIIREAQTAKESHIRLNNEYRLFKMGSNISKRCVFILGVCIEICPRK